MHELDGCRFQAGTSSCSLDVGGGGHGVHEGKMVTVLAGQSVVILLSERAPEIVVFVVVVAVAAVFVVVE